jgi:ankyrin repeat protein
MKYDNDLNKKLDNIIGLRDEESLKKQKELLESGCDPNYKNPITGRSLIEIAAQMENIEGVKLLIKHGANPNRQGNREGEEKGEVKNESPMVDRINLALSFSAQRGKIEMVKLLLDHGANPPLLPSALVEIARRSNEINQYQVPQKYKTKTDNYDNVYEKILHIIFKEYSKKDLKDLQENWSDELKPFIKEEITRRMKEKISKRTAGCEVEL